MRIFQRKNGEPFGMPISIISDLDIRSIEYYKDQKETKKVYHITEDIKKKLSDNFGDDVNWADVPSLFFSEGEYEEYIANNKKTGKFAAGKKKAITAVIKEGYGDITCDDIEFKRNIKRASLQEQYNNDIKIFLPKCWTLEYDIAKSALFKKMALSIELSKAEMQDIDVDDELVAKKETEIEKKYNGTVTDEIAYQIFKPLNDGSVSKAITAQYLSCLLSNDDKDTIETDEYFDYIVKAIKHVTAE